MSTERIRVVVVDDSALFRRLIRDVLKQIPGCYVVGYAENGQQALEKIEELKPDLITLDVEMPDMNGIEVLRRLNRKQLSLPSIMVSKLTEQGAQVTTDALLEGAFDFVLKPSGQNLLENQSNLLTALQEKIDLFKQSRRETATASHEPQEPSGPKESPQRYEAVLIGTSTGGPAALRNVLPRLPEDFPLPILVVQHMPPKYTSRLADRLDEMCALKVQEAEDRTPISPGNIYIAPGGKQMKVVDSAQKVQIRLTDDEPELGCRPAVNYLLRSAASIWKERQVVVILTGMGRDGTQGCEMIREQGGYVITQTAADCAVYGMPKSVIENGLSDQTVRLQALPMILTKRVQLPHS